MPFSPPRRDMPEDFAALAPAMTVNAATHHWKTGRNIVLRWAIEAGIELQAQKGCMEPAPENWSELCADLSATAMRKKFGWGAGIIKRWSEETQIFPRDGRRDVIRPQLRFAARTIRKAKPNIGRKGHGQTTFHDCRTKSLWDEAADVLRLERWTVYRCNQRGAYDEKGEFWRVGNVVVSPDDLLRRADRYRRKAA